MATNNEAKGSETEECASRAAEDEVGAGGSLRKTGAYLLVGGATALLELVLFQVLLSFTGNIPLSNIAAVLTATVANFLLNRNVTFKSSSSYVRSAVLYALLYLFNMTFSTCVIQVVSGFGVPALAVKVGTMGCIVCWNYFLYNKVIFPTGR